MDQNYTVTAYLNNSIGNQTEYGGGGSFPLNLSFLNPLVAGYTILVMFNLAIPVIVMYGTRKDKHSWIYGMSVFLLFFLTFLFLGLYPSILWAGVIFAIAIIISMVVMKIGGGA
jgi:hypothetical protein